MENTNCIKQLAQWDSTFISGQKHFYFLADPESIHRLIVVLGPHCEQNYANIFLMIFNSLNKPSEILSDIVVGKCVGLLSVIKEECPRQAALQRKAYLVCSSGFEDVISCISSGLVRTLWCVTSH